MSEGEEIVMYEEGEKVFCHAFGHWYEGEITKIGRKLIHVTYTTGTGKTRVKKCKPEQISKEKREGERASIGRKQSERSKKERDRHGPVQVSRRLDLNQIDSLRLLSAFQVLGAPQGMYRVTYKRAREVIEELSGIKLKANAHPPRAGLDRDPAQSPLQGYLDWASDLNLQHGTEDALEPGLHIVQVVKEGEQHDLPDGTAFMIEREPEHEMGA